MPWIMLLVAMFFVAQVQAMDGGMDKANWYFGGGFGAADVHGEEEIRSSLQAFMGVTMEVDAIAEWPGASFAMEMGFQSVSEVERAGVWLTPLLNLPMSRSVDVFGRAGVELGQHSTLVAGIGVAHKIERNMAVRLEYVLRQGMGVLQFNLVYHPWSRPY